jgi:anhydro-N-acetylmuramic acid kinase
MATRYLGLISGTSVDGVDACIAEFRSHRARILGACTTPYPAKLRERVQSLITTPQAALQEIGSLDVALGRFFGACALTTIRDAGLAPSDITAIGHHGQTVFHAPTGAEPFSMQLGDPNSVAALTGITTVADFRRRDMAHGGQGAPLVPAFHDWLWRTPREARVIVNIGGIANVTVIRRANRSSVSIPDREIPSSTLGSKLAVGSPMTPTAHGRRRVPSMRRCCAGCGASLTSLHRPRNRRAGSTST